MEEELISKKELLNATGISYGQFYRWKRKGLIPDKWLMHKSTRTGQESFLPADRILPRIEKIKELKEDKTLKEIADLLSPELVEKKYQKSSLTELDWVNSHLVEAYEEIVGTRELYSFSDLAYLMVLFRLKKSGESARNIYLTLKTLDLQEKKAYKFDEKIMVARRKPDFQKVDRSQVTESGFCLIATGEVRFDPSIEVVNELKLPELVRELKLQLRENGGLGEE
ncbi:YhbD family protein [Candidatus Bipolaricaulota bacterium]|nr:YhbD family protein [Candidatus Bipolaricaulota bacterium]